MSRVRPAADKEEEGYDAPVGLTNSELVYHDLFPQDAANPGRASTWVMKGGISQSGSFPVAGVTRGRIAGR